MSNKKKESAKLVTFRKLKTNNNGYLEIERTEAFAENNTEALNKDGWFKVEEPKGEAVEPTATDLESNSKP